MQCSHQRYAPNKNQRDTRTPLEVMEMFITLIVVIVSWVFAHVQVHQIVYIKSVQFSVYQLYLNKTVFFLKALSHLEAPK